MSAQKPPTLQAVASHKPFPRSPSGTTSARATALAPAVLEFSAFNAMSNET